MASEEERYLDLLRRKTKELSTSEGPRFESAPPVAPVGVDPALRGPEGAGGRPESAQLEAIIQWHRPVLWIRSDEVQRDFTFTDPNDRSSPEILAMLEQRRSVLSPTIPAIGRIEVLNNGQYEWVGTGWVVACDLGHDIVITNAHVASEFAQRSGSGFVFKRGTADFSRPQSAKVDFREEISEGAPREFAITDVVWISDNEILDIGILRVATRAGEDRLSGPIRLAPELAVAGRNIAIVGYPGDDSRSYDAEKFKRLFGSVFGKKRLAPGRLMDPHAWGLRHDCSTLPGNSGSVVLDIETGAALGLHYSGTMFRANYAVPAAELARVLRQRPWQPGTEVRSPPVSDTRPLTGATSAGGDGGGVTLGPDGAVRIVLPLEITVKLGLPGTGGGASVGKASVTVGSAESAAAQVKQQLERQPGVLTVRPDYLFRDGLITDDIGVVVRVAPGASTDPATYGLRSHVGGIEVSVETADPETIIADRMGPVREAFGERRARYERDLGDPRFNLSPVTDEMKITLHVSPEAGWPMLKPFLAENRFEQFTIGMYHMTAPHVVEAIKAIARRNNSRITLSLDRQRGTAAPPDDTGGDGTKANDIAESETLDELETIARNRFKWAEASLGGAGLFASAYHIKVAVWSDRGAGGRLSDKKFWLSSGNWQSSNQAPIDKTVDQIDQLRWEDIADYNREWHAIVEHAGLAATFRNHLEQDFKDNEEAARTEAPLSELQDVIVPRGLLERPSRPSRFEAFKPKEISGRITVQPLLTPDNYPEVVAELISRARERVLIENQSFSLWSEILDTPAHFLKIVEAVRDRQRAGLDVRIIFRSGFGNERESLRRLKKFKMKVGPDHIRFFDTCHTKGIVIDNDVAVLGSHNWTAGGTGPNRDASLLIRHPEANRYFASLFEYDWRQVARNRIRLEGAPREAVRFLPPGAEATVPDGYRRISLSEFMGET